MHTVHDPTSNTPSTKILLMIHTVLYPIRDAHIVLYSVHYQTLATHDTEPEFLKLLKYNSAESASAGFRFNYFYIFNGKTLSRGIWTTFQFC
jgi:hypothetical protein